MGQKQYFQKTYCITLKRTPKRWKAFRDRLKSSGVNQLLDFSNIVKFNGIDGSLCNPPSWWTQGKGAWGCLESHRQILLDCLSKDINSVLILEDDAVFCDKFIEMWNAYNDTAPIDAQWLYFGGQHLEQQDLLPHKINSYWVQPYNVNRTHAYALCGRDMIQKAYSHLHEYGRWEAKHHIDHHYGSLHMQRIDKIYAANPFIIGQAPGESLIAGRKTAEQFWQQAMRENRVIKSDQHFILVLGLHRSGSSCLAGILSKLGVHLGNNLTGYEPTGGFEAAGIRDICESYLPFPSCEVSSELQLKNKLKSWITARFLEFDICGAKYPQLCYFADIIQQICGNRLMVICADRKLEESISSLIKREHNFYPYRLEAHQVMLWNKKEAFLNSYYGKLLRIDYDDICYNTRDTINRICQWLPYQPTNLQIENAVKHVDSDRRSVRLNRLARQLV